MTEENRNEQAAADESKEAEDSVTDAVEITEVSTASPGFQFGEDAVKAYPSQVKAALDYAADNKYEYGPLLREVELKWDVISVEPMADDIARVRLEFKPTSGFRGDAGIEYMDIDASGAILVRRQVRVPKANQPMMLMGFTAFSVILAVVLVSMWTVFKSDGTDSLYVAGRTLWIRSEEPKTQQLIVYQGADTNGDIHNWGMKPEDEVNNELVYVKVTLYNQSSGSVSLVIDEQAAGLLDGDRNVYDPINTVARTYQTELAPQFNVPEFIPMWGTVKLNTAEQVSGMLVFELPKGSSVSELRWDASDSAIIRYE
jgi:hypothetical protein